MLRSTLLLTAGLVLLPASAFAQGSNCPLHKKMEVQQKVQTAELSSITASAPSLIEGSERGVDESAITVQLAQSSYGSGTANDKRTPKKDTSMTVSPHAAWTSILQKYVSAPDGMGLTHFDYAGLKANAADKAKLDSYIVRLEAIDPHTLSENEAIAYWANLYNAVTIQVVTDNYPIKSIRKLGSFNSGPWKKDLVTVKGTAMSLDDIEHKTLRKKYPSPYIHYVVNCASVGCPNLLDEAWEADSLMAKRKKAAADYINSPRGAVVSGDTLTVSSIYDWFEEDFGGNKAGVIDHLRNYARGDLKKAIEAGAEIKKYDYDWSLNN